MNLSFWLIVVLQLLSATSCLPNNRNSENNRSKKCEEPTNRNEVLPDTSVCCAQSRNFEVYNGKQSKYGEFPSLAILHYVNSSEISNFPCAGTLINKRHILTAAHCVTGNILKISGKLFKIRLGEHNLSKTVCSNGTCNNGVVEMDIEKILIHEGYDNRTKIHDIALIRFSREITNYRINIRPVCLRWTPECPNPEFLPTHKFIAVGWGRTLNAKRSNVSNKLEIPWYHHENCKQRYSKVRINITDTQICAGGKFKEDTCDGDSGGPLLTKIDGCNYLDGIVSSGRGCGLEDWPGIYTNVTAHKDWIMANLK